MPHQVTLTGYTVASISAGSRHMCLLSSAGQVACWGDNTAGQLGIGSSAAAAVPPVAVSGLSGSVVQVASGRDFNCVLLADNRVQCWGRGSSGQLGNGAVSLLRSPGAAFALPAAASKLSLMDATACALYQSGDLACWGYSFYGQVGTGFVQNVVSQVTALNLGGSVYSVATGKYHGCAFLVTGDFKCWGYNLNSQLAVSNQNNIGDNDGEMPPASSDLGVISLKVSLAFSALSKLVVTGLGFGTTVSDVFISLGSASCPVTFVSPMRVECTIPSDFAEGTYSVTVARGSGINAIPGSVTQQIQFAYTKTGSVTRTRTKSKKTRTKSKLTRTKTKRTRTKTKRTRTRTITKRTKSRFTRTKTKRTRSRAQSSYCKGGRFLTVYNGPLDSARFGTDFGVPAGTSCKWQLSNFQPGYIKLVWDQSFSIELEDTLTVYDGYTTSAPVLARVSGYNRPPTVYSSGLYLLVTYTKASGINTYGFYGTATVVSSRPSAGGDSGTTASGNISDGAKIGVGVGVGFFVVLALVGYEIQRSIRRHRRAAVVPVGLHPVA
eukprot:TRINITY_DN6037_c0_g1_i4.p1 TRINITY_DN6037_c0_g1~~TRINITY_DN6037_c0_g1_i4.p1  ORF type:complete len:550 (+),score=144.01 TRINITY_DN6037_c0_g1_i4:118-1767(+)